MESERNSLLKVLLVDDEPYIRKGLNALIDWEAEGFRITGEAQNGDNAIQLLQEEKYDLIISDIKMPEMDGIEFITEVKNNKISEAKFVFLSGFYDYQYAKTAITYGCCDYILKPIQKDELLATLRKIIDDYQKEAGGEKNKRICEKAYLDRNLMAMIWGKYDDINVNHVQMKMHFMEDVTYIHCEISLKDDRFSRLSEEKRGEQQRKLYNCAGLLMKKQADHIIFGVTKQAECYDIGVIYNSAMAREKGLTDEEWLNWFLKELSERIGLMIVACAGSKVKRIEDLAGSYREAMMTRFFRAFPKNDKKIASLSNKKDAVTKNSQEKYYRKDWDSLIHAIEIGDKQLIR